jgi:hypothetical protein
MSHFYLPKGEPLSNINSESLEWLDNLAAITAQLEKTPDATHAELGKALNIDRGKVTVLLAIKPCLDPAAIEKVRQAGKANPPYLLSYTSAKALAGLGKAKVDDLPKTVHSALDVIFTHRLTTKQIKALVKWMISGKPAAEFDPRKKVKELKVKEDKEEKDTEKLSPDVLDLKKVAELLKKAEAEKVLGKETTAQKKLLVYFQAILESVKSEISFSKKKGQDDSNWVETVYLSWLADVSLIKKIKSKVGKGQSVTRGEKALLWLHKLSEWADWVVKHLVKLLKPILKLAKIIWKLLMEALEVLGLLKYIKAVLVVAAFVCFGWFAWEAWRYGPMHPFRILEPYCFRKTEESPVEEVPTPVAPQAVGSSELEVRSSNLKPKTTNSKLLTANSPPTAVYQPSIAWQSSDEDPKVLETEMAALPVNCIVKDFPLTPDEGMPGDLAVSRLQDLTNPDKYTMKIGKDTQRILSVNPTTTNLIINYKSTDPLVFDSSGPMNFFWEDVIMIHVDEVDVEGKNPKVIYQCSLIVSGAKEPLTIQCSTPADLKHLVSTMEYFIRASRLAHDTALAGMPYPSQGLRLNNQCLVEVLWANSPMANAVSDMETAQPNHVAQLGASQQVKAGVKLGDMVWSVDQNASLPPERKNLEAQLGALTAGSHDLFLASPTDREKGLVQMNQTHTTYFNPKRRKVILTVS